MITSTCAFSATKRTAIVIREGSARPLCGGVATAFTPTARRVARIPVTRRCCFDHRIASRGLVTPGGAVLTTASRRADLVGGAVLTTASRRADLVTQGGAVLTTASRGSLLPGGAVLTTASRRADP